MKVTGQTITNEQLSQVFEQAYELMQDHDAYAASRALLRESHPSFDAKLRDEARERCARYFNEYIGAEP